MQRDGNPVLVFRPVGSDLTDVMAAMIEESSGTLDPRQVFLAAIAQRIERQDER